MYRFFALWCLLGWFVNAVAQQPPLPFMTPLLLVMAGFNGTFSDNTLSLQLSGDDTHYTGYITFQGHAYPLDATSEGELLHGYLRGQAQQTEFSARFHGQQMEELRVHLGAREYRLHRQIADDLVSSGLNSESYADLSLRIALELHQFVAGLRYWLSGIVTEQQAVRMLESHLLPSAGRLRKGLGLLEDLLRGAQFQHAPQAGTEGRQLHELAELSRKGRDFFRDWETLLHTMLSLYQNGQKTELQHLAAARLPFAVKGCVVYTRDFSVLLRMAGQIAARQDNASRSGASLAPSDLLKWDTLHNMSEMMRDGMDIFKHWRQPPSQ